MPQPKPDRRLALAASLIAAAMVAGAASAAPPAPLAAEDLAAVDKAADYLAALDAAWGRFVQPDPNGAVSQGEIYLERPGKARFAYDPPSGMLMVSDGGNVSVVDPRLKTFDRYPLGSTPLALFPSRDVRVDRGVQITERATMFFCRRLRHHRPRRPPPQGRVGHLDLLRHPPARMGPDRRARHRHAVRLVTWSRPAGLDPALFVLHDTRRARPRRAVIDSIDWSETFSSQSRKTGFRLDFSGAKCQL